MGLMSAGGNGPAKGLCILSQFRYFTQDDRIIFISFEYITKSSDNYTFTFVKNCKVKIYGYQRIKQEAAFKFTYDGTAVISVSSGSGSGWFEASFSAEKGKTLKISGYNERSFAYYMALE